MRRRSLVIRTALAVLAPIALVPALAAYAGPSPAEQCQAGKNKAAGKYAACRQNAEAQLATTGNTTKYGAALAACGAKLTATWQKLEAKAADAGATCLDGAGTVGAFQPVIDAHTGRIAAALAGGSLQTCGNDTVEAPEQCDGTSLANATCATQGFAVGTLRCASGCTLDTSGCFAARWVDNGDGTVTDNLTKLQWEKKTDDGSVHDTDNLYAWCIDGNGDSECDAGPTATDGTVFTDFLTTLNGGPTGVGNCASPDGVVQTGGFAGHCDWRVPTIGELETLFLGTPPCPSNRCIDPVLGPTAFTYFSSTTASGATYPTAYVASFSEAGADVKYKAQFESVRAVRGGH